jgi:hypothetical protein
VSTRKKTRYRVLQGACKFQRMTVRRFWTAPTRIRGQRGRIANALRGVNYDTFGSLSFAFVINAALFAVLPPVRKASRARCMGSPDA